MHSWSANAVYSRSVNAVELVDVVAEEQQLAKRLSVSRTTCTDCDPVLGVGSVVGMNNADVAGLLGLDVLLVGNGGLGSTYDVMALNKTLCTAGGVRVRAVLLNKVCVGSTD